MDKHTNNLLIAGICILALGLILLAYSVSSYIETKELENKIDFTELENNNQMPDSEKYNQYLTNSDFLNQKLNQNKNLPVKNAACAYADYAQHNAISLYELTKNQETSRRTVAEGNIKSLLNIYESYTSCKNVPHYKDELEKILDSIQKQDDFYEEERMNHFLDNGQSYQEDNTMMNTGQNIPPEAETQAPAADYTENSGNTTMQTGGTY